MPKHITQSERFEIYNLQMKGWTQTKIAKKLNKHKSTICRELKRNRTKGTGYLPDTAHTQYIHRRQKELKINQNKALAFFVEEKLVEGWTPEEISGYLKHRQTQHPYVCHESIYVWLYNDAQKEKQLFKYLKRAKKKRGLSTSRKRSFINIKERVSIHKRPSINNEFGHFEGDLMSYQNNSKFTLTLVEKKSRKVFKKKLSSKHADVVTKAILKIFNALPKGSVKSLTLDNGLEFAHHYKIAHAFNIKTYFCDPYKSWQKGAVENMNGRVRADLPRMTNMKNLSEEELSLIVDLHNARPRKCLEFDTPDNVFYANLQNVNHDVAFHL